jgi:hypothetical protein
MVRRGGVASAVSSRRMVDGVRGERGNTRGAKAGEVMHVKKKSRKELTTRKEACVRLHARSNM